MRLLDLRNVSFHVDNFFEVWNMASFSFIKKVPHRWGEGKEINLIIEKFMLSFLSESYMNFFWFQVL